MKKNDGGPAFPSDGSFGKSHAYGMTLRDWFAGQAISQVIDSDEEVTDGWYRDFSKSVYKLADAMLKERDK